MSYTAPMVDRARQLAEDGWTAAAISRCLKSEFGTGPSRDTVRAWIDPEAAERLRTANAASKRRQRAARQAKRNSFVDDVMLTLRLEDELTYSTIAKVLRRFYAVETTPEKVRFRLYDLGVEKNEAKVRATREMNAVRKVAA